MDQPLFQREQPIEDVSCFPPPSGNIPALGENPSLYEPVPPNAVMPQYSIKRTYKNRKIRIKVRLQRVPDTAINLWPTPHEFYLDTFKYSTKYLLRFPYPFQIEVNVEKAKVDYIADYLHVEMPILFIRDPAAGDKLKRRKGTPSSRPQERKRKFGRIEEDYSGQLSMVDQINDVEDKKRTVKEQKDYDRKVFIETKRERKVEKKRKKGYIKRKTLKEITLERAKERRRLEKLKQDQTNTADPPTKKLKRSNSY
jgi:hypothetical protein